METFTWNTIHIRWQWFGWNRQNWMTRWMFYQSIQTGSNLEYVKLKLSNFTVKLQNCNPVIALFDTGATCSCISYYLLIKIADKVNTVKKTLWVNTASGAILGPIGLTSLTMNIEDHSLRHNFIICTKLKQPLIIGLDFAQRYRLGVDWDMTGTPYLYMTWMMENGYGLKKGNTARQVMSINWPYWVDKQVLCERIWVTTKSTVTPPPHHSSIVPFTSTNYTNETYADTLMEMEENPFFNKNIQTLQ